jgi:hypothetical protein
MGTNAKVLMQFEHRPQAYGDWNGYLISDDPVLYPWESTVGVPGQHVPRVPGTGGRVRGAGRAGDHRRELSGSGRSHEVAGAVGCQGNATDRSKSSLCGFLAVGSSR